VSLPVAILAGGLATRLRPVTERIPKVLVEVAGKPFIVHQLELLRSHGLTRVVLCVGHLGELVESALGSGDRWGVEIRYVFDGEKLLGTGGALKKAIPLLGDSFFVLYGDTYLECDYRGVATAFSESGKLGLMTVFRNANRWDRSNVLFENGRILIYDKHASFPGREHIDYGLGVLRAKALDSYEADRPLDLAAVYQNLLAQDQLVGFEVRRRFYEIGSPEGLAETEQYLKSKEQTDELYPTAS